MNIRWSRTSVPYPIAPGELESMRYDVSMQKVLYVWEKMNEAFIRGGNANEYVYHHIQGADGFLKLTETEIAIIKDQMKYVGWKVTVTHLKDTRPPAIKFLMTSKVKIPEKQMKSKA